MTAVVLCESRFFVCFLRGLLATWMVTKSFTQGSGHCVGPPFPKDRLEVGRTRDPPYACPLLGVFKCGKRRTSSEPGEGPTLDPKFDTPSFGSPVLRVRE